MTGKTIKIHCMDGYLLEGTVFEPDPDKARGVVIICSALGVERRFYHKFAQYLWKRRCLIIGDGFYECKSDPDKSHKKTKYYFQLPDKAYADWLDPGKQDVRGLKMLLDTCCVDHFIIS